MTRIDVKLGNVTECPIALNIVGERATHHLTVDEVRQLARDLNGAVHDNRKRELDRVTAKLKGTGLITHEVKANEDGSFTALLTEVHK